MTQEQRTEIMYRYREMIKPLGNNIVLFNHHTNNDILYYTIVTKVELYGFIIYNGIIEENSSSFTFARISMTELSKMLDKGWSIKINHLF